MSDKFNLDEYKKLDGSDYGVNLTDKYDLKDILNDFKEVKSDTQFDSVVDKDIIKPDNVSLTGAFEAIRSSRSDDCMKVRDIKNATIEHSIVKEKDVNIEESELQLSNAKSLEITEEINHARFFDTDTFNSIKNSPKNENKNPIKSFAQGNFEEDEVEEECFESLQKTEEIDDYNTLEDRECIALDLKKMRASASLKTLLTFTLTFLSGIFFVAGYINIPGIDILNNSKLYLAIVFLISIIATFININSLIEGVKHLATFKCNYETMLFMLFIFNSALDINYLISNVKPNGPYIVFDFLFMLLLSFNIYSKNILAKNISKNFTIVSTDGLKTVVNKPVSEEIANDIMLETGNGGDIVYATKSNFVSEFIQKSFADFELSKKFSPLYTFVLIVVLLFSFVNYYFNSSFALCFTYASAALCAATPFLHIFSFASPLFNNSRRARKQGGAIIGSVSSFELDDAQTLIVDDSDVFTVTLNGIRLYGDAMIDDAILYLNSLYRTVGGPLKSLFTNMLSDNITTLPRIDDIYYHDTMGYSGLIHSKTFVAGNKSLMDHFGIEVDDSEFDLIYQQKARHVLFVAYDNKLMGVFLLSYKLSFGVDKAFMTCEKDCINIAIAERDSNVNASTLFACYKAKDQSLFKIMNFRTARNCFNKFETQSITPSLLVSNTGLKGITAALHGCKNIVFAFKANNVVKNMASIIGIILITFLLLFSNPTVMLPIHVILYQLLWSLPVLFVSLFSK